MPSDSLELAKISHLALRIKISEDWLTKLSDDIDNHVRATLIKRGDGTDRTIYIPSDELKFAQRKINQTLLQSIPLPDALHGSVPGKSTVLNAEAHVDQDIVAALDIRHFYPSIRHDRINRLFKSLRCAPDVSHMLTRLTTYNYQLAQGFPTSPAIANLILISLWERFRPVSVSHNLRVTIYQDDITVSGDKRVMTALPILVRIIEQEGFEAHKGAKRRIMRRGERQIVTGWIVNEKVNIPHEKFDSLRTLLYRCRTEGIREVTNKEKDKALRQIRGWISEIERVNPKLASRLLTDYYELAASS